MACPCCAGPISCAPGSALCDNVVGVACPDGTFKVIRDDTYCGGAFFEQTESYADCQDTIDGIFKAKCDDLAFSGIPEQYDDCWCINFTTFCRNYSVNEVVDPDTGACLCVKSIVIDTYRSSNYVYSAVLCRWKKVSESIYSNSTGCVGYGDCACPEEPTCTPPANAQEYVGCQDICDNPLP